MKHHYHFQYHYDRTGSQSRRELDWHCPAISTPFAMEIIEYSITMMAINKEIIATQ